MITSNMDKSIVSSSNGAFEDHESLDATMTKHLRHIHPLLMQACWVLPHKEGVWSALNVYIEKYIV
jgi:hypothetical protein